MPEDRDSSSALPEESAEQKEQAAKPATPQAPQPRPRVHRATLVGIAPYKPPSDSEPPSTVPSGAPEIPIPRAPSKPGAAVLMIGGGHAIQTALTEALMRHGMDLETAPADSAVSSAVAAAPDLILLVGDAAQNSGTDILRRLGQSPLSRTVPVAILADDANLAQQLDAFRHGAAAVIRRSASVDEIAERIAGLARQPPGSKESYPDGIGEVMLQDLLSTLAERLRRAVLSEAAPEAERVRLLLKDGREVARVVDEFAEHMTKHVVRAEAVEYELDQQARGKTALLGAEGTAGAFSAPDVRGLRIVIADDHSARADAVAHELRTRGATVLVTDLEPRAELFQRLRQLDPMALVIGDDQVEQRGAELVRRMRSDSRLRWASRVVVQWANVWPDVTDGVQRTHGMLASTAEAERNLRERAALSPMFDLRLESLGPARLLRALSDLPRPVRVTVYNPRARIQVDISEALIAGAIGEAFGDEGERKLEGYPALTAFLTVGSGRIQIERVERPACLNIMSPVDVAMELADSEPRPIAPSNLFSAIEPPSSLPPARQSAPTATPLPAPDAMAAATAAPAVTAAPVPRPTIPTPMPEPAPSNVFKRRIALPYWGLGLFVLSSLAVAIVIALLVTSSTQTEAVTVTQPPLPHSMAKSGSTRDNLLERARDGDASALAELERRQSTTPTLADAVAIAEGHAAQKLHDVERLQKQLSGRAPRPDEVKKLLELGRDPGAAPSAQALIATLPGTISADLLYEIWIGTPARTAATELAEQVVYTKPVLDKASPALRVTLDLRHVKTCEDVNALLSSLRHNGDRRALRAVAGLNDRLDCKTRPKTCLSCLPSRSLLVIATNAAKRRPDPTF